MGDRDLRCPRAEWGALRAPRGGPAHPETRSEALPSRRAADRQGAKPPRGFGGSWKLPREPLCPTCLGLATPPSGLPCALDPQRPPPLRATIRLCPETVSLVTRDTPHLTEATACRRACPCPLSPLGPPFPFAGMAETASACSLDPSGHHPQSKYKAAKSPPWPPRLPRGAHAVRPRGRAPGARACQGRRRQLGSHWAPARDSWCPPWRCLPTGPSAPPPQALLPAPTSNATRLWPTALPVRHHPASRPSRLLLGAEGMRRPSWGWPCPSSTCEDTEQPPPPAPLAAAAAAPRCGQKLPGCAGGTPGGHQGPRRVIKGAAGW